MATQARAVRTRAAILDAAALVFARRGYAAASFAELIAESGLTKGAFYFHFSSKEELALEAMRHKQRQLIGSIAAAIPPQAKGMSRLVALLRARARALEDDESLWCVLRVGGELGSVSDPSSAYSSLNEWPIELFTEIIREGQQDGSVRADVDARPTAEAVFASVLGMDSLAYQLSAGADLSARTDHLVDLLTAALAPRSTKAPSSRTNTSRRSKR